MIVPMSAGSSIISENFVDIKIDKSLFRRNLSHSEQSLKFLFVCTRFYSMNPPTCKFVIFYQTIRKLAILLSFLLARFKVRMDGLFVFFLFSHSLHVLILFVNNNKITIIIIIINVNLL